MNDETYTRTLTCNKRTGLCALEIASVIGLKIGNQAEVGEIARLRAGIIKARDALDNYDQDTSLFDIMSELDKLLGDTE